MIFVNSPGNDQAYAAVRHAAWHGWTPADFVFPSFLFSMGVSIAISLGRRLERSEPLPLLLRQVLWRTAVIFSLGLVISFFDAGSAEGLRLPGVLQRISACYLVCCLCFLWTGPRVQAAAAGLFLVGYWLLMTRAPVPGFGAGRLTPEGNFASYLDRLLLGRHLYAPTHDPEGILSTIPALSNALMGVLAGQWVRSQRSQTRKGLFLAACGAAALILGRLWSANFPVNKHIWTSPYALLTGGTALGGFAFCYGTIEIFKFKSWGKPFQFFGSNPLLSYFLSGLVYGIMEFVDMPMPDGRPGNLKLRVCEGLFGAWLSPPGASLLFALAYTCLCLGVMRTLYRKRIFLKI